MIRLIIGFIMYTLFINIPTRFSLKIIGTVLYCIHLINELAINYLQHKVDNM